MHVPGLQTCCGALHQHGGELERGAKAGKIGTSAAFEGLGLQAIISTASGCGAHLAEQFAASSRQPWQERQAAVRGNEAHAVNSIPNSQAGSLAARVMDISAFLAVAEGWDDVRLKPLPCKIAVH